MIMAYEPIKTKKNYEMVIDQIISMIQTKQLLPGEKLDSIETLANNFNVSKSVIREAFIGLSSMGLVRIQQGEGTFIANFQSSMGALPITTALLMKREDIKELFEVRKILEVGAVRLAAIHHSDQDIIRIEKSLHDMTRSGSLDEKNDFDFHFSIVLASQNKVLKNLLTSISDIMIETIYDAQKIILASNNNELKLIKEHELIYKAIKSRQPDQAEKHMLAHLLGVEKSLAPYIK